VEPVYERERYIRLRSRTRVDLLRIDEDISEMSFLIQEAGECACAAVDAKDAVKDEVEKIRAVVASELRSQPVEYGEGKTKERSEERVKAEVPLDSRVQEIQELYGKAKLDAGLWMNLVDSLRSKDSSLRTAAEYIKSGFLTTNYILDKRRDELNVQRKK
jgi:hypothetical protein